MPNPDFLIVGASRSGTTSLARYLSEHENVYIPPVKEVHFYDFKFGNGMDWYRQQFRDGFVNGEASPYYLPCLFVPGRIMKTVPRAKIIVLCREPGARAYSHYWFNKKRNEEARSFLYACKSEEDRLQGIDTNSAQWRRYSYLARGRYAEQLERWKDFHLLVVKAEELFENPEITVGCICQWLGIQPHRFKITQHNRLDYPAMDIKARAWLDRYFEPHNKRLKEEWNIGW